MSRLTNKQDNKLHPYIYSDIDDTFEGTPINKLGQLEDIEEEIGVDLVTLFKALKNGFYFKDDFGDIIHFEKELLQSLIKGKVQDLKKELKDYGKTWALTKEELL